MIMVLKVKGKELSSRSISQKDDLIITKCWVFQEQPLLLKYKKLTENWQLSIIRVPILATQKPRQNSLRWVRLTATFVTSSEGEIMMM